MEIKFDVYFKKNLGTLFKNNEVDLNGLPARTNLQLVLVDRLEINYKVGSNKYTDIVTITDATENLIQIPFKSDVMKVGLNEFEIVAYMKNGDVKTSQTYTYNIDEAIGEGKQTGSGGSSDGHTHNNLTVLNSITQSKISEWNNKADSTHSHSEYASESHNHNEYANITHTHSNYASATHSHSEYASYSHTHNASEIEGLENVDIDLSDYYTKSETYNRTEIDNKIANMGTGGSVDLSNYYTKSETDEAVNNKADKVHTHSEYLTELPTHTHNEYLTEHQDISHKADKADTYTKTQTDNKISEEIAKAQLGGSGEIDLSAYATKNYVDSETSKIKSNFYNKEEINKKLSDMALESGNIVFRDVEYEENFELENNNSNNVVYGNIITSANSLTVNEAGIVDFTVKLDKAPTNSQVINISINNSNCTVSKTYLTFNSSNYSSPQTVTVTGIHDEANYRDKSSTITLSSSNVTSKIISVVVKNIDIGEEGEEIPPTTEEGYVTENLDLMYDLTKYNDGYTEDVIDSVNNVKAIITGQSSYTTGRNGFIGGKFMTNPHKTSGMESSFSIPTRNSFTSYPFSIELYTSVRAPHNRYLLDNNIAFDSSLDLNAAYSIWSTRDGEGSGNGIWFKAEGQNKVQINGTLSNPLVSVECDLGIASSDNPIIKYNHIVVCCDANKQQIYINGELISDTNNSSTSLNNSSRGLLFFNNYLKGDLKLIRVYNSMLGNSQVKQNYNNVIDVMGGK